MAGPRRFDHDEAVRLRAEGWTWARLGAHFGVTGTAVAFAVKRATDPAWRQAANSYHREWQRDHHRVPCDGGCGRLVWTNHYRGSTGLCPACLGRVRQIDKHGTEHLYKIGCRCDECRAAANQARAERRRRPNVQRHGTHSGYSNGCRCAACYAGHVAYLRDLQNRRTERAA